MRNFIRNLQAMWTRPLYRENGYRQKEIEKLEADVRRHFRALNIRAEEFDDLDERVQIIYEGLGGQVWRTKQGHARFLALLSTEHLRNILLWPKTSAKTMYLVQRELDRRKIDEDFRMKEGNLARIKEQALEAAKADRAAARVRKAVRKSKPKTKGKAK